MTEDLGQQRLVDPTIEQVSPWNTATAGTLGAFDFGNESRGAVCRP